MSKILYWPYDEVSLSSNPDCSQISVIAPWLTATVAVSEENRNNFQQLLQKFENQTLAAEDLGLVNWFFREFSSYPLCYLLPTDKSDRPLDAHGMTDHKLLSCSLEDLLHTTLTAEPSGDITQSDVPEIVSKLARRAWDWDTTAALAFATIGDKIHPESIFSVARRFHLLDVLTSNKARENFNFIEGLEGADFALAASLMVRQNHYVTQKCHSALQPALARAGHSEPLVASFMNQENGHDKILNVAMTSFSESPDLVPVSTQTKALMHLLKFAAKRNFLGFAMAVDFFERSSYEKTDPLAQLLLKGGFTKAAGQINRHMDINDAGGHENIACTFLHSMAPCDIEYALEALRIAEAVTLVMNSVPHSAVELFERHRRASPRSELESQV